MKKLAAFFPKDEPSGTAIEHAVIAAGIGLAIVIVIGQIGGQLITLFDSVR